MLSSSGPAAAASAQGIQNLALGLRCRHYIPPWLGMRNKYDVAANPVWLEVVVCAAGVFILLSLTGWAAVGLTIASSVLPQRAADALYAGVD